MPAAATSAAGTGCALDGEAEPLRSFAPSRPLGAIARRIVGRDLDELGEEAGLGLLMGAEEFVDGVVSRHGLSPQVSVPSVVETLDPHPVISRNDVLRQPVAAAIHHRDGCAMLVRIARLGRIASISASASSRLK